MSQSTFEKIPPKPVVPLSQRLANSLLAQLFINGFLILLLLIPVDMIQGLIRERQGRRTEVINEVSSKWGNPQTIQGPILTVPYHVEEKVYDKSDAKTFSLRKVTQYAHFLPEQLHIEGKLNPEIRYRSIFEVILYNADITLKGTFAAPRLDDWGVNPALILWPKAFVSLELSDLRGIQDNVILKWQGRKLNLEPGSEGLDVSMSVRVPVTSAASRRYPFEIRLNVNGSQNFNLIPIGKDTTVQLRSAWKAPSFAGAFLPDERQINDSGFTAKWKILQLNREFPQKFINAPAEIQEKMNQSTFGVDLLLTADNYQQSTRSAKYAILLIGLTFVLFFFIQVLNKVRIHPVQYLLVGLALCIFYTLLVSMSEHLAFGKAYLIASLATVVLITGYTLAMFRRAKKSYLSLFMAGMLAALYGFVYVVLQLEDYSLLVGSLGLFVVMAAIMFGSRNIDWYGLEFGNSLQGEE